MAVLLILIVLIAIATFESSKTIWQAFLNSKIKMNFELMRTDLYKSKVGHSKVFLIEGYS